MAASCRLTGQSSRGMSKLKEDFRRALLRVFLVRTDMVEQPPLDDMYPVFNEAEYADYVLHPSAEAYADTLPMNIVSVENGTIKIDIPQSVMAQLPVGVYSLKAVWFKNKQLLHDATHVGVADKSYSIVQNKFAITDVLAEATNPEIDNPVLNVQSGIATYGYNGLDSYEEAVLNGETLLSRGLWIANLSEMNSRFNEIQLEWDNDDEEEPGLKQQVEAKITDVETRMVSVENQWDDVKDGVDEKMGEWSEAESQRESNETTRISNETTRQSNETTRQGNETTRQGNETVRLSQESGRVSAESTRVSNETTRISNESARQSQESTRQSNETTRQNQESEREIQAARDHSQASSDHTTAASDHTTAQSDHTTAASDHTTAQSDHDSAVQSTAIQYAEGDDDTTAPSTGWQDTVPEVEAGKYLWSRTTFTYGDGTTKVVYGVSLIPTVTVTENSTNGGVDINLNGSALPNGNVAKQSELNQLSQKLSELDKDINGTNGGVKKISIEDVEFGNAVVSGDTINRTEHTERIITKGTFERLQVGDVIGLENYTKSYIRFFFHNGVAATSTDIKSDSYTISGTPIAVLFIPNAGYSIDKQYVTDNFYYNRTAESVGIKGKIGYMLEPTGENDANNIERLLNTYGICQLTKGTFFVSSIVMPEGTRITGAGESSVIRLLDSVTEGSAIVANKKCTIDNVSIIGSDSRQGGSDDIGGRNGIYFDGRNIDSLNQLIRINSCSFIGFDGCGIEIKQSGHSLLHSVCVDNCKFAYNKVGLMLGFLCEFAVISNCLFEHNYFGLRNDGGNNMIANCGFGSNTKGLVIDSTGLQAVHNNGHGTIIGCTFCHNSNRGLAVIGCSNGMTISACTFYLNKSAEDTPDLSVVVTGSSGILFSNCLCSPIRIVVTNSSGTKFNSCRFTDTPVLYDNVEFVNCDKMDGSPLGEVVE